MDRHTPVPGEFYRHFKGKLYQIHETAEHTETGEQLVIYQALYGGFGIYARPLNQFMSPVDHVKYPESKEIWRFTQVEITDSGSSGAAAVNRSSPAESAASVPPAPVAPAAVPLRQADLTPEELFLRFLDADTCKEKLEIFSLLSGKLTRSMTDSIAASMDLVLPGKSMETDLELIEDHIRTRAKFESRR